MYFVEKIFFQTGLFLPKLYAIMQSMKRVIETEGMCCKKCAERAEKKLLLSDGVTGARANYKKGTILVETFLSDKELSAIVEEAGFTVIRVRERKGVFDRQKS